MSTNLPCRSKNTIMLSFCSVENLQSNSSSIWSEERRRINLLSAIWRISVIKMIISVAVWRIYPSWVNDKLGAWEGLGHSGMFWARLSRDDFRSKLEVISFLSRVMFVSKSFFVSRAFDRFGAKCSSSGDFVSKISWRSFWKLRSVTGHFFCELRLWPRVFFWKFLFFFPKQSRCYLPDSYGDPQSEQSTLVMVRRKLGWKLDFRALARSSAEGPSIVVAIGTSRVRWSMAPKEKKTQGSQRVIVRRLNPSSSTNQRVLRSLFPRPDVATVLHFAVWVDVDVQLQDGQAAARGKRRKAVIRDISGVDHWGVTNLSAPIWFTGRALHRFSSREAILVVVSVLKKHFDKDFTPDQEKEITFKHWPPGYQSWKLGLALNGLMIDRVFKAPNLLFLTSGQFFPSFSFSFLFFFAQLSSQSQFTRKYIVIETKIHGVVIQTVLCSFVLAFVFFTSCLHYGPRGSMFDSNDQRLFTLSTLVKRHSLSVWPLTLNNPRLLFFFFTFCAGCLHGVEGGWRRSGITGGFQKRSDRKYIDSSATHHQPGEAPLHHRSWDIEARHAVRKHASIWIFVQLGDVTHTFSRSLGRVDSTVHPRLHEVNHTVNPAWAVWEIPRSRYTHVTGRRRMSAVVFACRFEELRLGHTFGSMRAWQPKYGCSETDLLLAETFI